MWGLRPENGAHELSFMNEERNDRLPEYVAWMKRSVIQERTEQQTLLFAVIALVWRRYYTFLSSCACRLSSICDGGFYSSGQRSKPLNTVACRYSFPGDTPSMASKKPSTEKQSPRRSRAEKQRDTEAHNVAERTAQVVPESAPLSVEDTEVQPFTPATAFPIVGVGTSAGGLDAFTHFLKALPADTGMAFVFVQHLSPNHESQIGELLTPVSTLSVTTIAEGMSVAPNCVYIMPPNTYLTIAHGVFHLTPRSDRPTPFLPIDHFLRSLAQAQKHNAIAVILSGNGSDGALGVEAIKAEGGITFAQKEQTAQSPSMPRCAIATGAIDFILSPEESAQALKDLKTHVYLCSESVTAVDTPAPIAPPQVVEDILQVLEAACGTDLRLYRRPTLTRRMLRRMALHRIEKLEDYRTRLQHDAAEVQALYQDMLIKVTTFFRNPEVFAALQKTVFPQLVQGRAADAPIRVWAPGCATGEEVYSLAICLLEFLQTAGAHFPLQIFGTDVSEDAIAKARAAVYVENVVMDVSPERLQRFFIPLTKSYQVSPALREMCIFARQDVTQDPPLSKMDVISCRNMFIYMESELQQRLLSLFHYALKPGGFLLLGSSESANAAEPFFRAHDAKHRIYTKEAISTPPFHPFLSSKPQPEPVKAPSRHEPWRALNKGISVQQQADRVVLAAYGPPGVILNRDLEILHFRGDTSPFLKPAPGRASFHILKMVREGLLLDLRNALTEALRDGEPVIKPGLQVMREGRSFPLTLRVTPLSDSSGENRYLLVLFEQNTGGAPASQPTSPSSSGAPPLEALVQENTHLHKELAATREYLQTIIEEREAANEELQSSHEELLSTNEELQSLNEELETAKEELQASNEELTTVNEELRSRNATLVQVSNDLTNLLTAVNIPILIVDRQLRLRHFTPAASALLNLLPVDAGRPLTDLSLSLHLLGLEHLIRDVIDTLTPVQRDMQIGERLWYTITIRPYQTEEKQIDGAVLVFTDISLLKESELRYRQLHEQGFASAQDAMALLEAKTGRIIDVNPRFVSLLGWSHEEVVGKPVWEVPAFQSIADDEAAFSALTSVGYRRFEDVSLFTKAGQRVDVDLLSIPYPAGGEDILQFSLHDLTERKQAEKTLHEVNQSLLRSNEELRQFAYAASHDLREPLRQVSVYTQLLASQCKDAVDTEAQQYIEYCLQGAQRMQLLLEDLSTYLRAGEAAGEPPLIDCNAVLQRTLKSLQPMITENGAVITASLLPSIRVHEGHLVQILQNLLSNAIKYRGEQTPQIHISAAQRERGWLFAIQDNGMGIEPQYHTAIFQVFKRLHGREYEGTGMGLAICQRIIEHYGGRIWVESERGKGSTFLFTFDKEV